MSDNKSNLKDLEEEKKALTKEHTEQDNTDVNAKPGDDLNEITEVMSEAKVRHDSVK